MTTKLFPATDYQKKDDYYWQEIEALGLSAEQILKDFPAYARRRDIATFLAHYELFKHVIDLPGCVAEFGVFNGASLFTWAALMETFCPGDRTRKIFGFDWFKGLEDFHEKDGKKMKAGDKQQGAYSSEEARLDKLTELHNLDGFLPNIDRVSLVKGDVRESVPQFLEDNPGVRFSLAYLDMDLYDPTKSVLNDIYDRVVQGGVIAFDEYGLMPWEGESRAVEEFFDELGIKMPRLQKMPFSTRPHGYFIKE